VLTRGAVGTMKFLIMFFWVAGNSLENLKSHNTTCSENITIKTSRMCSFTKFSMLRQTNKYEKIYIFHVVMDILYPFQKKTGIKNFWSLLFTGLPGKEILERHIKSYCIDSISEFCRGFVYQTLCRSCFRVKHFNNFVEYRLFTTIISSLVTINSVVTSGKLMKLVFDLFSDKCTKLKFMHHNVNNSTQVYLKLLFSLASY
jgi:hypothetical protein